MSLDGFVADSDGNIGRLYSDFAELQESDSMSDSIEETGAELMGRRTFEMGDPDRLEKQPVQEAGQRTGLRFRIVK